MKLTGKIIIGAWALFFVLILFVAGCTSNETEIAEPVDENEEGNADLAASEQSSAPTGSVVTSQVTVTEEIIEDEEEVELSVCGDGNCESNELKSCEEDCPSCDDNDVCTIDSFNLETLSCRNRIMSGCCGDGFCGPEEECAEDCPTRMLTLASYPYPFVHGDDLEADIVVGDEGTAKEVAAATAIALGLGIQETVYGTLASDISTIKNTNVILVGNPCSNVFIAELIPYMDKCYDDYEEGEGRISMFATGESDGDTTYALVVSGHSDDDIRRAAGILENYEFEMAKLKGTEIKV